jgi:hypothetical protein
LKFHLLKWHLDDKWIYKKSYPIKDAFAGWEQGFEDTKMGISVLM